jgi:hypothetical protein
MDMLYFYWYAQLYKSKGDSQCKYSYYSINEKQT